MKIFLSYRRLDSAGYALLLSREIASAIEGCDVFLDTSKTPPGVDFRTHIRKKMADADVAIVLIGDEWRVDRSGADLLGREQDHVRGEIRMALEREPPVHIVPVLVEGTRMPDPADLPEDVAEVAYRHAHTLSDHNLGHDLQQLVDHLRALTEPKLPEAPARQAPAGSSPVPARITTTWIERTVPAMTLEEVAALVAAMRARGWIESDVEAAVKRSPYAPDRSFPRRFTDAWLARNVPLYTADQLASLVDELLNRNWTREEIRQRVLIRLAERPFIQIPDRITERWLRCYPLLMTVQGLEALKAELRRRGWDDRAIAAVG